MKKRRIFSGVLFFAFVIFTVLVRIVDVRPIGPEESLVGFSTLNQYVHNLLGVHMTWYHITDWLGLFAVFIAFCFAGTGVCQLIKRKSIKKVDPSILALGGFYVAVVTAYLFFEKVIINYRPILLDGGAEPSYPSSHAMIVLCIMATAMMEIRALSSRKKKMVLVLDTVFILVMAVTVVGRLISGVHWFTDIIGGILLSAALVTFYGSILKEKIKMM